MLSLKLGLSISVAIIDIEETSLSMVAIYLACLDKLCQDRLLFTQFNTAAVCLLQLTEFDITHCWPLDWPISLFPAKFTVSTSCKTNLSVKLATVWGFLRPRSERAWHLFPSKVAWGRLLLWSHDCHVTKWLTWYVWSLFNLWMVQTTQ